MATVAVYKLASCSGCQAQFANLGEELVDLLGLAAVGRFHLVEAQEVDPPYDVGIVEGGVVGTHSEELLRRARRECGVLVALGACATDGGILRQRYMYNPPPTKSLPLEDPDCWVALQGGKGNADLMRPLSDVVEVDALIPGCPADLGDLRRTLYALLHGIRPDLPGYSVCQDCIFDQNECLLRQKGFACLGATTVGGCAARCPAASQPCWGCRGCLEGTNPAALRNELDRRRDLDARKFYETSRDGEMIL